MNTEVFAMDLGPAEITIYGNWFLTQGDVNWCNRYFYFRLKHAYASFTEYESDDWVESGLDEIQEWGMDYPQDEVTLNEVAKLFRHLVVITDRQYLEDHEKSIQEMRAKLAAKGETE